MMTSFIFTQNMAPELVLLLVALMIWSIVWKGFALWHAARLTHKWWFVILLVVNTAGILEILYIFLVAKKQQTTTEESSESVAH